MATLYIFGNGFDMHYNLPTKPSDFRECLERERVYGVLDDAASVFEDYNVLWSNFEEDIANIDLERIEEEHLSYPDYLSDHEYDRDGVILDMQMHLDGLMKAINNALISMTKEADNYVCGLSRDFEIPFSAEDAIVTFNYTSTVEELYLNKLGYSLPILHIHGVGHENDKLILGYAISKSHYNINEFSNPEDGDYYLEQQVGLINDFYEGLRKNLRLDKLSAFLDTIGNIDHVVVYGHAVGSVDVPYYERINERFHSPKWYISRHGKDDVVVENVKKLSFVEAITFFEF